MRKGRYVINDTFQDIDCLTGLSWSIDTKNTVNIRWSWPRNGGIKLAAVFYAEAARDSLEQLLNGQEPTIITKDMDKNYTRPLGATRRLYRVFPAYFGEGSDIIILNQEQGTSTDVINRIVTINCRLEHKPLPLSEYRRTNITLGFSEALPNGCELAYLKYRDDAYICKYPLGHRDGTYACYLKKNEQIQIIVPEEYRNVIFLKMQRS